MTRSTRAGRKGRRAGIVLWAAVPFCLGITLAPPVAAQQQCTPESVVRADAAALNSGDRDRILALFNEDATVFSLPRDHGSLVGAVSAKLGTQEQRRATFRSFAGQKPDQTKVIDVAAVGDLALAKLRITSGSSGAATYFLAGYRISSCRIAALWHIARADTDQASRQNNAVIDRLVQANNAGSVEAFLDTFDAAVLHFRSSGDPRLIGDRPSKWNGDLQGRRRLYAAMFAKGPPVQVTARTFAVGDLVVSRDVAARPDGSVVDEMSIYRIGNGRITHDWLLAELPRAPRP